MECPHIEECVKIEAPCMKNENPPSEWSCSACETTKSPWVCLSCGVINCGRYVNGHAKDHYETIKQHSVCMDCDSMATFWVSRDEEQLIWLMWSTICHAYPQLHQCLSYICDEFVINDTTSGQLDKIRCHLQSLASTQNHQNHVKENCEIPNHTDLTNDVKENCENPRRRKLSESADSSKKRLKTDHRGAKVKPKTSGLRNLGNTCFMNAVLQSLSNIQSFCGYIKQLPSLETKMAKKKLPQTRNNRDGDNLFLVEELRKTLVALWGGNKSAISPESLFSVIWKVVPRFRGYQQQDAHEFMRYLLDRLHNELLTILPYPNNNSPYIGPKGKSTIVTTIFGGILQSEVKCLICGMESKKHDPFLDLSLDIPSQFSNLTKDGEVPQKCNLSDCLSSFTDIEVLEDSELYCCSNCKKKQRSTKRFWIRRLPNVLCLHLKRFRWSSCFRVKIDTHVDFPLRGLNMNSYLLNNMHGTRNSIGGSNEYDLAAAIVHHGSGAGSGHYTSYAIHEGRWYHFNDSSVTACDEETVMKCKGYILFYVRRQLNIPEYLSVNNTT